MVDLIRFEFVKVLWRHTRFWNWEAWVRVRHPDFNNLWENEMENTWSNYTMTLDEAREWCLSIGMTEMIGLSGQVGG